MLVTCELICLVPLSLSRSLSLCLFQSLYAEGRRLSLNLLVQVQCIENPFSAAVTAILFHWIKWGQSSKSKDYTGLYKEQDDTNTLKHANTEHSQIHWHTKWMMHLMAMHCIASSVPVVNLCGCSETNTVVQYNDPEHKCSAV